jgi:hypothetical protein
VETHFVEATSVHSCEVDIVLLNDAGIERIEVHYQDIFIPEPAFGFENQSTLILVALAFRRPFHLPRFVFVGSFAFLLPEFVGTYILEAMKLVEKNEFISFRSTANEGFTPVVIILRRI